MLGTEQGLTQGRLLAIRCRVDLLSHEHLRILLELLSPIGQSVFVRPAKFYVNESDTLPFTTLMYRARANGEILLGYYKSPSLVPVINPKNKTAHLVWTHADRMIILAEDGPARFSKTPRAGVARGNGTSDSMGPY